MNKTIWKPEPEINLILKNYNTFAILSCGICANLSYTGGKTGVEVLKAYLLKNHKQIKLDKVILAA
ncbi:MAG TPA: hypothetical protein PLF77_07725, partial [Smithella sp.]|nr:hypothetical protein [Smithella sp.]